MNEIVPFIVQNPVAVLTDPKSYSEFYLSVKAQLAEFVPDTSTERGRKEIASMAYKVRRSKTAIDDAGKKLNEDARAKINAVDASRRKIRDELEALATEVRKPLTAWEDAEDARKEQAASDLKRIAEMSVVLASDTAEVLKARWEALNAITLREDVHLDGIDHARAKAEDALDILEAARARAQKHEDDQRELARLRAEQEERDRIARETKAKEDAERAAKERAEQADAEQKAREERVAEGARQSAIREAAAEQRRRDAEAAALRAEQEGKIAKLEAEKREAALKAEREESARQEAAARERREQEAREADRAHRGKIMGAAKDAMIPLGAKEPVAKAIVLAIVANEIPNVSLRF